MYLRTKQRRNKDGSVVCYLALAENRRHPDKGHEEARVIHSFGREDHAPPWYVVCCNADEAERQRRRPARGPGRRAGAPAHGASEGGVPASRRFGPYLARDADGRPQIDRRRVARAERLDGR
jgi:hypothetical protein